MKLIEDGQADQVVQETRLWDEGRQATSSMRKKEGLADYRYFPEPDLPELTVTDSFIERLQVGSGAAAATCTSMWSHSQPGCPCLHTPGACLMHEQQAHVLVVLSMVGQLCQKSCCAEGHHVLALEAF